MGWVRQNWLFVLVLIAIAGWVLSPSKREPVKGREPIPEISGWAALAGCEVLTSFDGKSTLVLSHDQSIKIVTGGVTTSGAWAFADYNKRYTLTVDDTAKSYFLFNPPSEDFCILGMGTVDSTNLRESFFAGSSQDERDPD
jgi:hypothetical protein